jgi:hypothetical protein
MRLLLANLVWNFDAQLVEKEGKRGWFETLRVFVLWNMEELVVKLVVREGA